MLAFFLFTGIRFTIKSNFFQFKDIKTIVKIFTKSITQGKNENGVSQFSVFCSVLGACIGTGNIVGVATAINSGGPGTVFWMILSALFSSMTAYAENYLGAKYSYRYRYTSVTGGAFLYMENGLEMKGLAKIYAFLSLFSALGMGNMTQSNSLADAVSKGFNIPVIYIGIAVFILAFIVIIGGIKRISGMQSILVPLASVFYFIISILVLVKFKSNTFPCILLIIKEAFSFKAIRGYSVYSAIRYGIARGVFSNEAGLGSSTILHSQGDTADARKQGILAIIEVIIDTVIMCTVTAVVLLVSTGDKASTLFGAELAVSSYATIGKIGKYGISILTAVFAFTSLASCSFYAEKSFTYLTGEKYIKPFKLFYCILSLVACVNPPKIIWQIADICNGLMAIPNLFALNCLQREVRYD